MNGQLVGTARLSELSPTLLALDQISVDPRFARQGIGTRLLQEVAALAKQREYTEITGTTFTDVEFNAPFYARMGGVVDPDPHPVMVERRRVERTLGLDRVGARVVMRLSV